VSRTGTSGGLEADPPTLPSRERPLSVAALLAAARRALDGTIRTTWVTGEVDALNLHRGSGHYYFCLKDERAQVGAVMWRADAGTLRFQLAPGQRLVCRGHFDVYDRQGRFQFIVKHAEPAGLGADALAREQLKQRLAAEGLFEVVRKRRLPRVPRSIGLVTSKDGAAVRDVIRAVQRRFPVPIVIADCRVQGAQAPVSITDALRRIAAVKVDVVIVGRGGGAATDLAAFDDERVVRAVAGCPVPTISAVGHEIDISLTDLVADQRAATPTMAGEMAVPVWSDLYEQLTGIERRMQRELEHALRGHRQAVTELGGRAERRVDAVLASRRHALGALDARLAGGHPRARLLADRGTADQLAARARAAALAALDRRRRALDGLGRRLAAQQPGAGLVRRRNQLAGLEARAVAASQKALTRRRRAFAELVGRLDALSPLAVLERGYAIASKGGHVLTRAADAAPGDRVTVRLASGALDCAVEAVRPPARGDGA
jgi:exodeoxyribonuclease VII large subunit